MRRTDLNEKVRAANAAAVLTAIILLTPAQLFAYQSATQTNVPAAKENQPGTPQAATSRATRQIPQREIIVSLPDKQLALLEDGKVLKTYKVAVGADVSRSPEGDFTVINRLENPTYYRPGKVIGPGKGNPLGTRWMGLSKRGYGIHGTNEPNSIGKAASHGCIRMKQRDLEELFTMVSVGDKVMFRDMQMTALIAPLTAPNVDVPALALNANTAVSVNATPTLVASEEQ